MVVGTPGRVLQHIEDVNMVYGDIKYLVRIYYLIFFLNFTFSKDWRLFYRCFTSVCEDLVIFLRAGTSAFCTWWYCDLLVGARWGRYHVWPWLWSWNSQISTPIKEPCIKTWWPRVSNHFGHRNNDKGMLTWAKVLLDIHGLSSVHFEWEVQPQIFLAIHFYEMESCYFSSLFLNESKFALHSF